MNREERIGMNEAVFRDVNERIQEVASAFDMSTEPLDLICECGSANCVDRIALAPSEYEQLRADPRMFAVAPGHVTPDVEKVVEERKGYDIVQKFEGTPAEIARQTDPRRDS